MKIYDSIQKWQRHLYSARDFINGEPIQPLCEAPLSRISFPIIVGEAFDCFGAMAFYTHRVHCSLHAAGNFEMNVGDQKAAFVSSNTDISIKIASFVERLLGKTYPVSEKFLAFEIDPSVNSGIAGLDLESDSHRIEGGSYNLAFLMHALLDPIGDALTANIALTGKLVQNGSGDFIIDAVEDLEKKIYAVASYKIDKFFVPRANIEEIAAYETPHGAYVIDKGGALLEMIPVDTPDAVLAALFGAGWFELPVFRNVYDLKYMLQQEIGASNFVRIKNILAREGRSYADIDNYVKIKVSEELPDQNASSPAAGSAKPADAKGAKTDKAPKAPPPILPSQLIEEFGIGNRSTKMVIAGDAGSGKSTILRRLLFQLCNETCENARHLLPVFIELKSLTESENNFVETLVECFLNSRETADGFADFSQRAVFGAYIKALCRADRVLFLLDAFDEMMLPDEGFKIGSVANAIITTRYIHKKMEGISKFEVQPLDREAIRRFVDNSMQDKEKAEKLFELIEANKNTHIAHLFKNPLMLSLMTHIIMDTGDSLKIEEIKRTRLIAKVVELLVKKIEHHKLFVEELTGMKPADFAAHFYTKIAKESLHKAVITKNYDYDPKHISIDSILRKMMLDSKKLGLGPKLDKTIGQLMKIFTVGTGLIEHSGRDEYRFFHQMFHEFFVVKYVDDHLKTAEGRSFIQKILSDDKWRDVFLLLAENTNNADAFFKVFSEAIDAYVRKNGLTWFLAAVAKESRTIKLTRQASELHKKMATVAALYEVAYEVLEMGIINPRGYNGGLKHHFEKYMLVDALVQTGVACGIDWKKDESSAAKFDRKFHEAFGLDRDHPNRINLDRVLHRSCRHAVKSEYSHFESNFDRTLNLVKGLDDWYLLLHLQNLDIPPQELPNSEDWVAFGNRLGSVFVSTRLIKDYYMLIEQEEKIINYLRMVRLLLDCLKTSKVADEKQIKSRLFLPPDPERDMCKNPTGDVYEENHPYLHCLKRY